MDNEKPVGYVEPTEDGFNRFICPVKNPTERVEVFLTKGEPGKRKLLGYYNGEDKGLKPSRTQAWVLVPTPEGDKRIPVYVDA